MSYDVTDYQSYLSVRLYPEENTEVIVHFELDTIIVAIVITNGSYVFHKGKEFELIEPELCCKAREILKDRYIQLELKSM